MFVKMSKTVSPSKGTFLKVKQNNVTPRAQISALIAENFPNMGELLPDSGHIKWYVPAQGAFDPLFFSSFNETPKSALKRKK